MGTTNERLLEHYKSYQQCFNKIKNEAVKRDWDIDGPHLMHCYEAYTSAKKKILFIGQEPLEGGLGLMELLIPALQNTKK